LGLHAVDDHTAGVYAVPTATAQSRSTARESAGRKGQVEAHRASLGHRAQVSTLSDYLGEPKELRELLPGCSVMGFGRTLAAGIGALVAVPVAVIAAAMVRVHVVGQRARGGLGVTGETLVVFGSRAFDGEPGPILRARLDHAVALYRSGRVDRLAMAGGVPVTDEGPSGGHDEVPVMVAYAREAGVPDDRILEVRPGQNTREQVTSTRRVIIDAGMGPVVAVSSSYHLARILDEARRQGFDVCLTAPATSHDVQTPRLYMSHVFADALAGLWYALPPAVARRVNTSAGSFRHLGLLAMTGDVTWREALRSLRHRAPESDPHHHVRRAPEGEAAGRGHRH
jgi:uncharacterized SAM-binding protein YcdF (DUF218 family)